MHSHLEIIMPKTTDISGAIASIMAPFNEFWDFYVIGGRWAGEKEKCRYNPEVLQRFFDVLQENNVTVSSFQAGKQTLFPSSQIPMVDKLWSEFFPTEDGTIVACPIFSHSNNQYDSNDLLACDICLVEEIPENLTASRVIVAGPNYKETGVEATFMLTDSQWNGVNHMPIAWDGNVKTALEMCKKHFENYKEEWKEKVTPKPDWICVTVDYHS